MPAVIGVVRDMHLAIYQGADLNFDVEWFASDGTTAIDMSLVQAQIRLDGQVILELDDYITIDSGSPNIAHIAVPGSVTESLDATARALWDLNATAADSGEIKKLMRGTVRIFAAVTSEVSS